MVDKKKKKEDTVEDPRNMISSVLKFTAETIPSNYSEIKRYSLIPPFCDAVIAKEKTAGDIIYLVDERPLLIDEQEGYEKLRECVERDLAPPSESNKIENYHKKLMDIVNSHEKLFIGISSLGIEKIIYYLERDIIGFGKINSLMHDPAIEDVSCAGINKPIFIFHQEFDSMKTNIFFDTETDIEDFVMKQVHRAGKHTSAAFPVTDVTLPGKHRLAIYYKTEVTPFGTSFTIRKFREDPFTMIDMIRSGTVDENIAAYFWLLMENKMSAMVVGSTGAGKTTSLNAICCLMPPYNKIITVEEVSEINLPHENWVALLARTGFGLDNEGEISLFSLIKSSLRHRPDFIIVGEVRGEESYVLFQALATGHGGLCTMHADSVASAIERLSGEPMNISPTSIPLMNCAAVIKKIRLRKSSKSDSFKSVRRMVQVSEILGPKTAKDIFKWNPLSDTFDQELTSSRLFSKISSDTGTTIEEVLEEFEKRKIILRWMADNNIRDYRDVSKTVAAYLNDPDKLLKKAKSAV